MEKKILIKATEVSPSINFNAKTGFLQIHGRSLPENAVTFYKPALEWIDKYSESPNNKTVFEFRMVLLNTSSSKVFIDIFRKINHLVDLKNSEVSVVWYYEEEDEDIEDIGIQYEEICKAEFKMIATHFRLMG